MDSIRKNYGGRLIFGDKKLAPFCFGADALGQQGGYVATLCSAQIRLRRTSYVRRALAEIRGTCL